MRNLTFAKNRLRSTTCGLSLIELLIALSLGAFMLIGIISLIVSMSQSRVEFDKTSEQIENGRYALQLLSADLHNAGFYGVPQPAVSATANITTPDACAIALSATGLGIGWYASATTLPVPVYGYKSTDSLSSCLQNAKATTATAPRTEALTIRSVSPVAVTAASVGTTSSTPYIQVSAYNTDTQTISSGVTTAAFTLHDFSGGSAWVRQYMANTYYLSGCDDCSAADGIPTLKMATLSNGTTTTTSLVEGIEDMHFEYGLDLVGSTGTSTTHDGTPDCYVDDPTAASLPANCPPGATWATASPYNWPNVVSIRIHLLARSVDTTPSWTDTGTYDLGRSVNGIGVRSGPFNDHYKRQVYTLVVTLNNVSGARK